jgi:GGDEF domain-containing protein
MPLTDNLTELYDRKGFVRASNDLLAITEGRASWAMLLSIEVAHIKFIEHALGLGGADGLLMRAAAILREIFQENAVIGQWEADQFVVLNVAAPARCYALVRSLNDRIDAANESEREMNLSLSGRINVFNLPLPVGRNMQFNRTEAQMQDMQTRGEAIVSRA